MSNIIYTGNGDDVMVVSSSIGTGGTGNTIINANQYATNSTVTIKKAPVEFILDKYDMNELCVEHKVTSFELLKLKEVDINFTDIIKSNLTKSAAEHIMNRMSFTKKYDMDNDSTTFRGRIWVFTKDELEELIKDARNA